MNVDGKVAIVTGGAVRIGRALSLALAEKGARVCLHYGTSEKAARETVETITARGGTASAVQADFRSPAEAALRVLDHAVEKLGQADILLNSASIFEPGDLADTTEDAWDRHFAINLKTPFLLCREFARRRHDDSPGHIVNIVDWRALRPGTGHLAYTLTKGALVTLTEILAQELAPAVQVNAIAPGAILPPPGKEEDHMRRLAEQIPLRRTGAPENICRALLFLLECDFVTGEVVRIDGGEHL